MNRRHISEIVAILSSLLLVAAIMPESQAGNTKKTARQQKALVERGRALVAANQCMDCHQLAGKGCVDGISLDDVAQRSVQFLTAQLQDPEKHVAQAVKDYHGQTNMMTAPNLSKEEIRAVVAYLKTIKKHMP